VTKEERNDTNVRVSKKGTRDRVPGAEEKHAMFIFITFSLRDKPTLQV
jgi:hypothetical protein